MAITSSFENKDKSKESQTTILINNDKEPKYTIKDSVFRHLFRQPKYALQLYRILHPEDTKATEADIAYLTLVREITDDIRNDLGLYIRERYIFLIEAQTTWSVNILVRMFIYLAETWKNYIARHNLDVFSSKAVKLPVPELYVVYTGSRKTRPKYLKLSKDIFQGLCEDVELTVHMLYNGENKGDILNQYVSFTEQVDIFYKKYGRTKEAAEKLIAYCVEHNILAEYLLDRKEEVTDMMDVLFDYSIHKNKSQEQLEQEAYEAGLDEGRRDGRLMGEAEGRKTGVLEGAMKKARETAEEMHRIGIQTDVIAQVLKVSLTQVEGWLQAGKM